MSLYKSLIFLFLVSFTNSLFANNFLLEAAKSGDTAKVLELLNSGVDVNYKNISDKKTAMHYAVIVGDEALVDLLITKKANILIRDKNDKTPLLIAAQYKRKKIGKKLIKLEMIKGVRPFAVKKAKKKGDEAAIEELWGDLVFIFGKN